MGGRASMRAALIKANDNYKWSGPGPNNEIDHYVFSKLKQFKQNPAAVSDDLTFLRRVSLDVTGSLPSSDTARSFLSIKEKTNDQYL